MLGNHVLPNLISLIPILLSSACGGNQPSPSTPSTSMLSELHQIPTSTLAFITIITTVTMPEIVTGPTVISPKNTGQMGNLLELAKGAILSPSLGVG